jgi:hypothetical protein
MIILKNTAIKIDFFVQFSMSKKSFLIYETEFIKVFQEYNFISEVLE